MGGIDGLGPLAPTCEGQKPQHEFPF